MPLTADQSVIEKPRDSIFLNGDLNIVHEQLSTLLVSVRRHLHKNPEIGLKEFETSKFIREVLEMHGLTVLGPVAETGLYVDIKGDHPGPLVAYRADIDALPIQDAKDVPYNSGNPGVAHLCGHDAHTSMAIGLAVLLHGHRDQICGTVRVFFQPNEEGIPSGAPLMIRDGIMEGVKAVFASHVDPTVESGVYGLLTGPVTASADRFRVRVISDTTGHSARPHQATDTIWIASQIMTSIYQLPGRISDVRKPAVVAICRLKGGEAYNVIPSEAEFGGTYRCTENDDREIFRTSIEQTAVKIGQAFNAEVKVDFDLGCPPVINDSELIQLLRETISDTLGADAVYDIPVPSMGAEDFAHYLGHAPGVLLRVGTSNSPETSYVLHDSKFDIDESVLPTTSQLLARTMINYLNSHAKG
ncbi:MAG: amidohydrolase [Bacteroidetes Order II. Incertae sedis bacterium]|jgi:amidohydrolase|nr:amidohydrolase [Bacteroidetes Order II. bacterium]MDG1754854.1 amidohydrolase [Rhodothermales bacterium]HAY36462.1 amidohydrolase [Bacteroidota bacterium]MBT4603887.1 amidohydrolase [Bacteroidetes Order II. bacterium]MBT5250526.1 amidohydrolase [Bacteroidetes Order II. bacterium]